MTTTEACAMIVDLTKKLHDSKALAESRAEDIASYRLLAQESLHALAELTKDHDRLRSRYYELLEIHRQHVGDEGRQHEAAA